MKFMYIVPWETISLSTTLGKNGSRRQFVLFRFTNLEWNWTAFVHQVQYPLLDEHLLPHQRRHFQYLGNAACSRICHDQEQSNSWNDSTKRCIWHKQNSSCEKCGFQQQHVPEYQQFCHTLAGHNGLWRSLRRCCWLHQPTKCKANLRQLVPAIRLTYIFGFEAYLL